MRSLTRPRRFKCLMRLILLLSLAANACLLIILFTPLNEILHGLVQVSDPPRKSEVIVVLSSTFPFNTTKGVPCMSTLMRLEKGLELYRAGYADKIIALGGIWIPGAEKTTGQAMKERLLLYGVPADDIIVHDDIVGVWEYYDNLMLLLEKYEDQFDFSQAMFITSSEQSFRIKKSLSKKLKNCVVVTSEPYEFSPDWGRRFHLFRRVANEILFGIPSFYFFGRF